MRIRERERIEQRHGGRSAHSVDATALEAACRKQPGESLVHTVHTRAGGAPHAESCGEISRCLGALDMGQHARHRLQCGSSWNAR